MWNFIRLLLHYVTIREDLFKIFRLVLTYISYLGRYITNLFTLFLLFYNNNITNDAIFSAKKN